MSDDVLRLENYELAAKRAMAAAQRRADAMKHATVTRRHLLAALLEMGYGFRALRRAGTDPNVLEASVEAHLACAPGGSTQPSYLDDPLLATLARAEMEARRAEAPQVTVEHLFRALAHAGLIPPSTMDHWAEESIAPNTALPFGPLKAGGPKGKEVLRGMTMDLWRALNPAGASLAYGAQFALDSIETALTSPTSAPEIEVVREARARLRISRSSRAGEVVLTWSAADGAIVMTYGVKVARLDRFHWNGERKEWLRGAARDGQDEDELFHALRAAILEELYPEVKP